eukprot:m.153423 g.153423  ORF g.153423 m.153423 type:complete len:62 (+) comp14289_c0_seq1:1423-1608(+)
MVSFYLFFLEEGCEEVLYLQTFGQCGCVDCLLFCLCFSIILLTLENLMVKQASGVQQHNNF